MNDLWNTEETSPEIQKRGTSGPKIGHVNVSDKKTLKKKSPPFNMKSVHCTELNFQEYLTMRLNYDFNEYQLFASRKTRSICFETNSAAEQRKREIAGSIPERK